MGFDVELLFPLLFWGVALWWPATRNVRFISFMVITTAAWVTVGSLGLDLSRLVRAGLIVLWVGAELSPSRIRLGSLSGAEVRFDESLRSLDRLAREAAGGREAARAALPDTIEELETMAPPDPRWATIKDLVLSDLLSDGAVSTATYQAWRRVRYRNVIGRR